MVGVLGPWSRLRHRFVSAIPHVLELSWHSGGRRGMTKKRRLAFLFHFNHKSLNRHWVIQIGLYHEFCTSVSSETKPISGLSKANLCKSFLLLALPRASSLQRTIWWICSTHHPSSSSCWTLCLSILLIHPTTFDIHQKPLHMDIFCWLLRKDGQQADGRRYVKVQSKAQNQSSSGVEELKDEWLYLLSSSA